MSQVNEGRKKQLAEGDTADAGRISCFSVLRTAESVLLFPAVCVFHGKAESDPLPCPAGLACPSAEPVRKHPAFHAARLF